MKANQDTIVGLATAPGAAAVAIVRISGPDAFAIADRIVRTRREPPSRRPTGTFFLGPIETADGETLDHALVLIMRAPGSYTGEHTVELQGHGGPVTARRIMEAAVNAGGRPAEPGEFTRRAFLNGRLDLIQAEAVAELIRSRTDRAARNALRQLNGSLSSIIKDIYERLLVDATELEVRLDFDASELGLSESDLTAVQIRNRCQTLSKLLCSWNNGNYLRNGVRIVIVGRPNVGKSTLFNALLGIERAIVSPQPGTTRDTIEASVDFHGVPMTLVDTAGLRDTFCSIEQEGVKRTRNESIHADYVIYVADASDLSGAERDSDELRGLDSARTLCVMNKSDMICGIKPKIYRGYTTIFCSMLNGDGLDDLRAALHQMLNLDAMNDEDQLLTSVRQKQALEKALGELKEAESMAERGDESEQVLMVHHIRNSATALGEMIGRVYSDDMLDEIFSRFCVGK